MKFFIAPVLLMTVFGAMAGTTEVRIDRDGYLVRNGERIFVLGAYHPPKGKGVRDVADLGFNLLRISPTEEAVAECAEAGLWTWHGFDLDFTGDVEQKKESIQSSVGSVREAENVLIWESVDEPAWTDGDAETPRVLPEPLIEGYNFLKSLDSRPVYLNHAPRNTVGTLKKYNPAADILCVDIYPILPMNLGPSYAIIPPARPGYPPRHGDMPDNSPACIGDYVDKMKDVADPGQAVFMVLQGFAWEALRPEAERNPDLILYPAFDQLRFMAWQAVIHGVNGLTFWGLSYTDDAEYLESLRKVLHEVRDLTPAILAERVEEHPVLEYFERGSSISKGIEMLITQSEDASVLFAVNASIDPATVRFSNLPEPFKSAKEIEVVGENRSILPTRGSFAQDFDGLGVHIYRVKN